MASFNVIPYLGPPIKHPRSFKKPNNTIENAQRVLPLQDTRQVCPGDDLNRPQLVCSFRSSMEPTSAQGDTEHGSGGGQTRSLSFTRDQQVQDKDDLDSDWICSSRSSTSSIEPLKSTQQAEQSGTYRLTQISETDRRRQADIRLAPVKSKQQHKRKAGLFADTEEQGDLCSYENVDDTPQAIKPDPICSQSSMNIHSARRKRKLSGDWNQEQTYSEQRGELAPLVEDSSNTSSSKHGRSPDQPILIQDGEDNSCLEFDRDDGWVVKQIKGHRSTTLGLEFKVAWEDTWIREEDLGTAWKLLRQYKSNTGGSQSKRSRRAGRRAVKRS